MIDYEEVTGDITPEDIVGDITDTDIAGDIKQTDVEGNIEQHNIEGDIETDEVEGITEGIPFENETDPTVPSCVKSISSGDIQAWDQIKDMTEITNLEIDAIFK